MLNKMSSVFLVSFLMTASAFYLFAIVFIPFGKAFLLTKGMLLFFRYLFVGIFAVLLSIIAFDHLRSNP